MTIKYFALLVFLFVTLQSFGQVNPIGSINQTAVENRSGGYINIGPYKVKGSPYFLGESFIGTITYQSEKGFVDRKIFYNLYDQKAGLDINNMLFEADERVEQFFIRLPAQYENKILLFKRASQYKKDFPGFFNVLENGEKLMLLKYFTIRLIPDTKNMMAKDIKVFEQYHEYYLYFKNSSSLKKFKSKQKEMMKELGNEEDMKKYLSTVKLDFSKEADLIEAIKVYNNK